MNLLATIGNNADYNFLPRILTPGLRVFPSAEVTYVSHDAMQGPTEQNLVFLLAKWMST